jgi:hypothetical protein
MWQEGPISQSSWYYIWAVEKWVLEDKYGIKKRINIAHDAYVEKLEEEMDSNITAHPASTQVLQIFRLKAEAPDKYREEVKVLGTSAPFELLDKIRELAAKDLKEREALEAPAVEGEFREVGLIGQVIPPVSNRLDTPTRDYTVERRLSPQEPPKKPKRQPGRMKRR